MFHQLTIRSRLIFVISFLSLLLVSGGLIGILSLGFANASLKLNYESRLVPITHLNRIMGLINRNQLAVAEALTLDPEQLERELDGIGQRAGEIDQIWARYAASGLGVDETRLAEQFIKSRGHFVADGLQPAVGALRARDMDSARQLMNGPMKHLFAPTLAGMDRLIALQVDQARQEFENSQTLYELVRWSCIAGILFGLVVAALIGVWLIKAISRPLERAVNLAKCVSQGDLTQTITVESNDETGQLMAALKDMNSKLVGMVEQVRTGTDQIASASVQIAGRNMDLSVRTEQQADSLQDTAASMEQLTATVKQNADNAQQANQMAASACDVAVQGGVVVAKVVSTMGSINEASMKIVDIIGVIDSIAFQTNILALNAAVEAARAGEQGRGFAVVASEVRHLAQRSAAAAKEIKNLIGDSVDQVESGKNLVDQAGATMAEIVERVRMVTDIMSQISCASAEQTTGIEQVNRAIAQMDEATRQNATEVEQAAAVAQALQEQAQALAAAVSVFKLDVGDHAMLHARQLKGKSSSKNHVAPQLEARM